LPVLSPVKSTRRRRQNPSPTTDTPHTAEQPPFVASPFLKWAGGKGQVLSQLDAFIPQHFGRYFEPFVGSAAVFFHLRRKYGSFKATLVDRNEDLINCYQIIKNRVRELIPLLRRHQESHSTKQYYRVREKDLESLTDLERAARLIYLNKTCYNGLYRVNSSGQFNVPVGSYSQPRVFDEENLLAVSKALKDTDLLVDDFSIVLDQADRGDFVYFDPPYYTESAGFTGYAVSLDGKAGFGAKDHRRLSNLVRTLNDRGCHLAVSNSNTTYVRNLYESFPQHIVTARRFINCDGTGRRPVTELVITNPCTTSKP